MTESKGPDNQDGTAVPGKKKRGSRIRRLRPYAFGVVAMAVVFGISAVIGAHVRAGKDDKVSAPAGEFRVKEKASPPSLGLLSTRVTGTPASASRSAAAVPASPPPTTRAPRPDSGARGRRSVAGVVSSRFIGRSGAPSCGRRP